MKIFTIRFLVHREMKTVDKLYHVSSMKKRRDAISANLNRGVWAVGGCRPIVGIYGCLPYIFAQCARDLVGRSYDASRHRDVSCHLGSFRLLPPTCCAIHTATEAPVYAREAILVHVADAQRKNLVYKNSSCRNSFIINQTYQSLSNIISPTFHYRH